MRYRARRPTSSAPPAWSLPRAAAGFTVIELLVVVAIMVILTAIILPSYNALSAQNRRASCAANLKAIGQALTMFRDEYKCYPPDSTEFLWTPEAVAQYVAAYGTEPPGDTSLGTPIGAAYNPDGTPINTGVRGLGLYTLYYIGAYANALPPYEVEPRIDAATRQRLEAAWRGLNGLPWFRSGLYITKLDTFHCPSNQLEAVEGDLTDRTYLPEMHGWGNYDAYYRRNFWHPGTEQVDVVGHDGDDNPVYENRHLLQPYPPADTVVTWCPYHRTSRAPARYTPGVKSEINPGDQDLVLFADGTVRRMTSRPDNRMFEETAPGGAWPSGPIM